MEMDQEVIIPIERLTLSIFVTLTIQRSRLNSHFLIGGEINIPFWCSVVQIKKTVWDSIEVSQPE